MNALTSAKANEDEVEEQLERCDAVTLVRHFGAREEDAGGGHAETMATREGTPIRFPHESEVDHRRRVDGDDGDRLRTRCR